MRGHTTRNAILASLRHCVTAIRYPELEISSAAARDTNPNVRMSESTEGIPYALGR